MNPLPHHYQVTGRASVNSAVELAAEGVPTLTSEPPAEFGGPGDQWSPETLLVASIADCFILTFKAIARASKLEWQSLDCEVVGTLDRIEKKTLFTRFDITATLKPAPGVREEMAVRLLEKAEQGCLISNSLSGEVHLTTRVLD